jgi:hypothetical protein
MSQEELLKAIYDRMLDLYERVGALARELAEHRTEDRAAFLDLRKEIRALRGEDKEHRKKIDSIAEITGAHQLALTEGWSKTKRWIVRALVAAVLAAIPTILAYFLAKG